MPLVFFFVCVGGRVTTFASVFRVVLKGFLLYYCKCHVNVQKILADGMCVNVRVAILKFKTKQTKRKKM